MPKLPPELLGIHDDGEDAVDWRRLRNYAGFVLGSLRRRWLRVVLVFSAVAAATLGAVKLMPKRYYVETRILAKSQQMLPAVARPSLGDDLPTQTAQVTIRSRDNLLAIVKQTNLVESWDRIRTPLQRLKDRYFPPPPLSDEAKTDALVNLLHGMLFASVGEDNTVTLGIEWPEPEMAYRLVEQALQNFLEGRHAAEISTIDEAIVRLESRAAGLREDIDRMKEDFQNQRSVDRKLDAAAAQRRPGPRREPVDSAALQLKVALREKARAIRQIEDARLRHLADAQSKLVEMEDIYAEGHPLLVKQRRRVSALSQEPPELVALRNEERLLSVDYARRFGRTELDPLLLEEMTPSSRDAGSPRAPVESLRRVDDRLEQIRTQLRRAMFKYETLLERIDSARLELDTARAAFKHRYSIIWPAEVPSSPKKRRAYLVLTAGMLAAVFLAALSAVVADLRSGRLFEGWQIERALELPVLAELRLS